MSNANPVTRGFHAVVRDPGLFFMEVLWRWTFGVAAFLLLFYAVRVLSHSVVITDADEIAWRGRDAMAISAALLRVADESGGKLLSMALFVSPAITLLWVVLGALGRVATLKRLLRDTHEVRWSTILGLQLWRAIAMWVGTLVWIGTIGIEGQISMHGDQPDFALYYIMVLPSLLLIGVVWSIVMWYLALAPICALDDVTIFGAVRRARTLGRSHRAELGSVSVLSGILRVAGLMIAFVLCVATSGWLGPHPNAYTAWVVAVSLVYFAFADFLFAARQASFVEIVAGAAVPAAGAPAEPTPAR
jgi:hypothetical protein